MKREFDATVESGRERTDQRFKTKSGDLFGLFRIKSPFTGATLRIIVGSGDAWKSEGMSGEPWDHVSVSKVSSIPTWEEMCYVKGLFFDDSECVVQYHPPKADYVNHYPNVLHLWRPCGTVIPMPPKECV